MSSWIEQYKIKANNDGTVDIILPKQKKGEQRSIQLEQYQLEFIKEYYPAKSFSYSLRMALNDLIKHKNNVTNIILVEEEIC